MVAVRKPKATEFSTIVKISQNSTPILIDKNELFFRVLEAAREIGIGDPKVHEWVYGKDGSWFTNAVLRQERYFKEQKGQDRNLDMGYFVMAESGGLIKLGYTIRSFKINKWNFSYEQGARFSDALRNRGLEPEAFHQFGTVTLRELHFKVNENPLYK